MSIPIWPVSVETVYKVVAAHGIPKSREELVVILGQIDLEQVSEAASEWIDYAEQCDAVDVEIEDQLIDLEVIPTGTVLKFGLNVKPKQSFHDSGEIPWSNLNFFNRKPKVGKFILPMNREFGHRLRNSLAEISREDRGEQLWALMEILDTFFDEEEAEVQNMDREAAGAKFKMSVFDRTFFDLSMNAIGLKVIQTALANLVACHRQLDRGVFIFYKKIDEVIHKQEFGAGKFAGKFAGTGRFDHDHDDYHDPVASYSHR